MKGAQLALPVQLAQNPRFDSFFPGPNAAVVDALREQAQGRGPAAVWLYGGSASGKTHLLRASVAEAGRDARYLHAANAHSQWNALNEVPLLALDDGDALLADADAILPLLRLLDRRRQAGLPLLMAARAPPARAAVTLADLRTRLEAMAVLGLKPLDEDDRRALLQLHAAQRGLELPADAIHWLLAHLRRDAGTLIAALEEIDRATLSAKRRPTLPFVQQTLLPLLRPSPGP